MTPDELRGLVNMTIDVQHAPAFQHLPEHLRTAVEDDFAAVPAILQRASERVARVRANVLLSDTGKDDSIALIITEEETHLERREAALETDTGTYTAMIEKAERGRFAARGTGFVEEQDTPATGDKAVFEREIRDRLSALPVAERNRLYLAAVQSGDRQLTDAVEHAPVSFALVSNAEQVRRVRLETSPAKPALDHMRQALVLRDQVIGRARRAWEHDKGRVLSRR